MVQIHKQALETYSINAVEQLTGVKAHTLRIWEKRYQSLIPHRTATNIRYYDDAQLRKLLNISTLQQYGYKISTLMAMAENEINNLILELTNDSGNTELHDIYVSELVGHMLGFDEPSFDKTCSNVIIRYGIYEAMLKVIYPFLRKTGVLWSTNNAAPSQEHFASNIIKRKLLVAIDGIHLSQHSPKKFILFLPPDEWHEIGLLFADFMVRNAGHSSIYLGQDLPFESLEIALSNTKANYLLTFFTAGINMPEHLQKLSALAAKKGKPVVLVGTMTEVAEHYKNITFLKSPTELRNYL